ncbi:MAG: hypothetical protein ABR587_00860 [Candidatus Binatia bacterium]
MEQEIDDSIRGLLAELDRGREAWINGRTENFDGGCLAQAPDMTIFGPFGGDVVRSAPGFDVRQARVSAKFSSGTGMSELVSVMASGDLVVVVLVERNVVTFEDRDEPQPWVLRTTQVFRRDGERWIRLHRHADPLIRARAFEDTLAIAADV